MIEECIAQDRRCSPPVRVIAKGHSLTISEVHSRVIRIERALVIVFPPLSRFGPGWYKSGHGPLLSKTCPAWLGFELVSMDIRNEWADGRNTVATVDQCYFLLARQKGCLGARVQIVL